jgi:hypothetical protein
MRFDHVDPDKITDATKCQCGAVTVTIDGKSYSMRPATFRKIFGKRPPRKVQWWSCDHCANRYGVDICARGSGKPYDKCDGGFKSCGMPMQVIGKYTKVRAADAWGPSGGDNVWQM